MRYGNVYQENAFELARYHLPISIHQRYDIVSLFFDNGIYSVRHYLFSQREIVCLQKGDDAFSVSRMLSAIMSEVWLVKGGCWVRVLFFEEVATAAG